MIKYREVGSSTAQVVIPQVLQGLGGGFLGVTLQVAAQSAFDTRMSPPSPPTSYFSLRSEAHAVTL